MRAMSLRNPRTSLVDQLADAIALRVHRHRPRGGDADRGGGGHVQLLNRIEARLSWLNTPGRKRTRLDCVRPPPSRHIPQSPDA